MLIDYSELISVLDPESLHDAMDVLCTDEFRSVSKLVLYRERPSIQMLSEMIMDQFVDLWQLNLSDIPSDVPYSFPMKVQWFVIALMNKYIFFLHEFLISHHPVELVCIEDIVCMDQRQLLISYACVHHQGR
jgi:hypothetical protein|nr:MAG TPA: hypothetical protein [Caudoviricetes sp.]